MLLNMSQKIKLEKNKIRQTILLKRKAFTESKRADAEFQMLKILQNWDVFKKANSIHIFLSKAYEPKTNKII